MTNIRIWLEKYLFERNITRYKMILLLYRSMTYNIKQLELSIKLCYFKLTPSSYIGFLK